MNEYEEISTGGFDFESALITNIIDSKSIRSVIKHKITDEYFNNPQARAAFQYLIGWYGNPAYGDTPSWESFQHSFSDFIPVRMEDNTIALCDKVRSQKLYSDVAALIGEVADILGGDPNKAFESLRGKVSQLHTKHIVDESCDVRSRITELRDEYYRMKSGSTGLKGHAYPWKALNDATLGLQDQHLVFFYGRPKSGKTWLALRTMLELHKQGLKVVIFSQEMSDIEICRRFVALATGVDYNQYLRGQLPPKVEAEFMDNLEAFIEQESVIVDFISTSSDDAVLELSTKVDEYAANAVLIDAFYTLGQDWKELVRVMSGCKKMVKQKRIPLIGTTQGNRTAKGKTKAEEGADDFAYADAFYQWCDVALRISSDIEQRRKREAVLSTAALREGIPVTFTVNMLMANDLEQKAILKTGSDDDDVDEQISQDQLDGQSDNPEEAPKQLIQTAAPKIIYAQPKKGFVQVPAKLVKPAPKPLIVSAA